jgi:NADP-dependent 3-hydroxy acid dehydrogenase YdfG
MITGGATGIGYAMAEAFIQASAARVILIGRRTEMIESAVTRLTAYGKQLSAPAQVVGHALDVADVESVNQLWSGLEQDGIVVDVLVINHVSPGDAAPLLTSGRDKIWYDYLVNVRALIDLTEHFYKQKTLGVVKKKVGILPFPSVCYSEAKDAIVPGEY